MANLKGKKVLITGAACGIGFCLAQEFAKVGAELILTDINESALSEAKQKLERDSVLIHTYVVDVSNKSQVDSMAEEILGKLGGLDILVNNAGIGHNGELAETDLNTWKKLMDINFWGPLYHVYAFLPWMIKNRRGHIVNVSSGQAFFRLPTWGAYATIKLALGAFSEVLYFEVKKYDIKVTTVYPFMVNTTFYKDVQAETFGTKMSMKLLPYYSMTPEKVGKIIFKAIKKGTKVEMVSILNDLGYYARLVPPVADTISFVSNIFLAKKPK